MSVEQIRAGFQVRGKRAMRLASLALTGLSGLKYVYESTITDAVAESAHKIGEVDQHVIAEAGTLTTEGLKRLGIFDHNA